MTDTSNNIQKVEEEEQLKEYFQFDNRIGNDIFPNNSKKRYIRLFFILGIFILLIILIVIIIVFTKKDEEDKKEIKCKSGYFLPDDSNDNNCEECSLDNCEKCFGNKKSNICKECKPNFFAAIEKEVIKSCDLKCNLENPNLET